MRLCFIADGRSPTARSWIEYFATKNHDVHLLSTFPAPPVEGITQHEMRYTDPKISASRRHWKKSINPTGALGQTVSYLVESLVMPRRYFALRKTVRDLVHHIRPDLLHALRIPIEGQLAAYADFHPFVISVWGNDLTLHARNFPFHRIKTRDVMRTVNGLLADANADLIRAKQFGLDARVPTLHIPGGGGVKPDLFFPGPPRSDIRSRLQIPQDHQVVINPRGFRGYVRNDVFLTVIPRVLKVHPLTTFVCVGLEQWEPARALAGRPDIDRRLVLTESLSQDLLADLYRIAAVSVSPSNHDGTPNSLLEAMACGCLPLCGDLASIREWITSGVNGLLFNPNRRDEMFRAISLALTDRGLADRAREVNLDLIAKRAVFESCMSRAEQFYLELVARSEHEKRKTSF